MSARGESSRNKQRNRTQNDAPLENLISKSRVDSVSPLYQYCRRCRRIEGFVVPSPRGAPPQPGQATLLMAQRLGIRTVVIEHSIKDETLDRPVTLRVHASDKDSAPQVVPRTQWRVAASYLRSLQVEHEKGSPDCANGYDASKFLSPGNGKGLGKADFSVSNLLRTIPGVRHIDMDAALHCTECFQVCGVVEASSDGMSGTSLSAKTKGSSMSRRWGKMLGVPTVLLQHHVGDADHEHPVTLTMWDAEGKQDKRLKGETTWAMAVTVLNRLLESHECPHSPEAKSSEPLETVGAAAPPPY